jgi:hypothetical protein
MTCAGPIDYKGNKETGKGLRERGDECQGKDKAQIEQ